MAKGLDATLLSPYNRPVFGLETDPGPLRTTTLVEWDFGEEDPDAALPATNTHVNSHDAVRNNEQAKSQVGEFINTGDIIHMCNGPCDPD